MIDYIAILALVAVMILLVLDRYFFTEQQQKQVKELLEDNSRLVKAVMAKNAHDYVMTTSIDKVPTEVAAPKSPDEIQEETLTDDEFFNAIKKGNKE